ncbi:hypothetical protein KSF_074770 [Reticulibacter mediterranei]|uniref:Uncharacterized protein n=1 Tax=Reticulibacter mediterranei TaxID=2778369 RepID=A0A8J3IT62_9CHLR|nr:hypothetical protein KSF_074770 [Reticulibacter mediterranei]
MSFMANDFIVPTAHDMRNEVVDRWDIGEVISGSEVVAEGQRENLAPLFSQRVGEVCRTTALETKGKNVDTSVSVKSCPGRH